MILTVTLNVSIDKAYVVNDFKINQVNRVKEVSATAGGKGLNVTRNIKLLNYDVLATGFVGGFLGQYVIYLLNQQKIRNDFEITKSETRNCINILTNQNTSTELLEPGALITEAELNAFMFRYSNLVKNAQTITLSGSVPKGIDDSIYQTLIKIAKENNKIVLLDTSGNLLKEAIKAKPTLIKPNENELSSLGYRINNQTDIINAIKDLHNNGIKYVVCSIGKDGALLACEKGIYHAYLPPFKVINTVGCGDSMLAAFAVGLTKQQKIEEILKYGVAVSGANTLSLLTGHFETKDLNTLYPKVIINKL